MDKAFLLANFTGTRDFNQDDPLHIQELINKFTEHGGVLATTTYPITGTVIAEASLIKNGQRISDTRQCHNYAEAVVSVILRLIS